MKAAKTNEIKNFNSYIYELTELLNKNQSEI